MQEGALRPVGAGRAPVLGHTPGPVLWESVTPSALEYPLHLPVASGVEPRLREGVWRGPETGLVCMTGSRRTPAPCVPYSLAPPHHPCPPPSVLRHTLGLCQECFSSVCLSSRAQSYSCRAW